MASRRWLPTQAWQHQTLGAEEFGRGLSGLHSQAGIGPDSGRGWYGVWPGVVWSQDGVVSGQVGVKPQIVQESGMVWSELRLEFVQSQTAVVPGQAGLTQIQAWVGLVRLEFSESGRGRSGVRLRFFGVRQGLIRSQVAFNCESDLGLF